MVQYCVAVGCKNIQDKTIKIPFHTFPFKRPEILERWLTAMGRENWKPSKGSRLCSMHFTESDYQNRPYFNKTLKLDAIPSIFPVPCCAVAVCKRTSEDARLMGANLTLFRFPKDTALRKEWVSRCHRKDKFDPQHAHICRMHFKYEDYKDEMGARLTDTSPKKLKKTAVPSLHLLPVKGEPEDEELSRMAIGTEVNGTVMEMDVKDVDVCKQEENILMAMKVDPEYYDENVLRNGNNFIYGGPIDILTKTEEGQVKLKLEESPIHGSNILGGEEIPTISVNMIKKEDGGYQELVKYEYDYKESGTDFSSKNEEIDIKCEEDELKYLELEVTKDGSHGSSVQSELEAPVWNNALSSSFDEKYQHFISPATNKSEVSTDSHILRCMKCNYETPYKSNLKYHMLFHSDSGTYDCDVCFFRTQIEESLHIHMNIHLCPEDRPVYKCKMCPHHITSKNKYGTKREGASSCHQ